MHHRSLVITGPVWDETGWPLFEKHMALQQSQITMK